LLVTLEEAKVEVEQQGSGPDLLLIHSLLTELTVFDGVVGALSKARRVTRINLPGFGRSSAAKLDGLAAHAAHVARVMDKLELPADAAVFNGFGAFVALELAIGHAARFGKLLVADTLASFPEPARAPFRAMAERVTASGMQAVLDAAIGRMLPLDFQQRHPQVIAERKERLRTVDAGCFARACLALAGMDLTPRLAQIRKPVFVMCGELDQTTPPALAEALAKAIPGARYAGITASGHCPMLEQPQALVRLVNEFLAPA
jgi:3-oxoadipate enol-lactonase